MVDTATSESEDQFPLDPDLTNDCFWDAVKKIESQHNASRSSAVAPSASNAAAPALRNVTTTNPVSSDDSNWKDVKKNIIDHSIKSDTAQHPVFEVGDYVRIRIFKSDKDTPTFTYKKGPLWEIRRDDGQSSEEFQGVYLITGVRGGKSGKVARAPTYTILARWSKESTPDYYEANAEPDGTLPSSVVSPSDADRTIDINGNLFDGKIYKKPAYPRRFLKEELVRVLKDSKGIPIVEWGEDEKGKKKTASDVLDMDEGETLEEYEVESIVKRVGKSKVEVKWKGYTDTTVEPVSQVKHTEAYEKFIAK